MKISNIGVIVEIKQFSENDALIWIFSANYGIRSGLLKYYQSKKNRAIAQIGNIVEFTWQARIAEHLGLMNIDLLRPIFATYINDSLVITALRAICALLYQAIPERLAEDNLYLSLIGFFDLLHDKQRWIKKYIILELQLLSDVGFGLDLDKCVVTNSNVDLTYISPKSGKAITKDIGNLYKDKLFILPRFFIDNNYYPNNQEICNGLKITSYFIEKFILKPKNIALPLSRIRLNEIYSKIVENQSKILDEA